MTDQLVSVFQSGRLTLRRTEPQQLPENSMNHFHKFGIGPRLSAGFAVILALLVLVASAGVHGVSEGNDDLRAMYEDRAKPIEQLGEIKKLLLGDRIQVRD